MLSVISLSFRKLLHPYLFIISNCIKLFFAGRSSNTGTLFASTAVDLFVLCSGLGILFAKGLGTEQIGVADYVKPIRN